MISLDFSTAVALYTFIFLGVTLGAWILNRQARDRDLTLDPRFIWFCSVCTYTYINTREEAISVCPRCGSYNKK